MVIFMLVTKHILWLSQNNFVLPKIKNRSLLLKDMCQVLSEYSPSLEEKNKKVCVAVVAAGRASFDL